MMVMGFWDARPRVDRFQGETEVLQTDVMRFLAIICMCLMVIFALVQSLPDSPPPRPVSTPESIPASVPGPTPEAAPTPAPPSAPAPAHAVPASAPTPTPSPTPVPVTPAEDPVDPVDPVTPEGLVDAVRPAAAVDDVEVQPPVPAPEPRPSTKAVPEPQSTPPAPVTAPVDSPEGFVLTFSSDADLMHLLDTRSDIGLYLMSSAHCWQLITRTPGSLYFAVADPPARIYDMAFATVPEPVMHASKKIFRAHGKGDLAFGMQLPPAMQQAIEGLMTRRSGGRIVIDKQGQIKIKANGAVVE